MLSLLPPLLFVLLLLRPPPHIFPPSSPSPPPSPPSPPSPSPPHPPSPPSPSPPTSPLSRSVACMIVRLMVWWAQKVGGADGGESGQQQQQSQQPAQQEGLPAAVRCPLLVNGYGLLTKGQIENIVSHLRRTRTPRGGRVRYVCSPGVRCLFRLWASPRSAGSGQASCCRYRGNPPYYKLRIVS